MTRFANPLVFECAACGGAMLQARLKSFNTVGARQWSDGSSSANWALNDALTVCPHCAALAWPGAARLLGELPDRPFREPPQDGWWRKRQWRRDSAAQAAWATWQATPLAWREAPHEKRPGMADLLRALAAPDGLPPEHERWVRARLWQRGNDVQRWRDLEGAQAPQEPGELAPALVAANMERLLLLLGCGNDTLVMRAELLRHLGRFEEALRILKAGTVTGSAGWLAVRIQRAAQARDAALLIFDEA